MSAYRLATMLVVFVFSSLRAFAQITNVAIITGADAFIRADAPLDNFGRAGSLVVAGASATNGFGLPGGQFETLLRFPLVDTMPLLDTTFGNRNWFIVRAALRLNEVAAPANAIFPRGAVGGFEISWLAADAWAEGTGSPSVPTNDGVNYSSLPSLINQERDISLGLFTNSGVNGSITFELSLTHEFAEDLLSSGEVTLHLLPVSDALGFVFNSRNFGTDSARPRLELSVAAGPPPRITSIEYISPTEVTIRFNTRSNWTQTLQACDGVVNRSAATWMNIFTSLPRPLDNQIEVRDVVTNAARFYRLSVAPQ